MNRRAVYRAALIIATLLGMPAVADGCGPGTEASWLDSPALRWAPPPLFAPTVVYLPTGYYAGTFREDEDVILVMPGYRSPSGIRNPARGPRRADLEVRGGRHVRLIGGDNGPGRMMFVDVSGSVFIEGVSIALKDAKDAINVSGRAGTRPDVYLQNISVIGVRGSFDGVHADVFQPHGPVGHVRIDRFSGGTDYQGFFLAPQSDIESVEISRTDLYFDGLTEAATYLYWFTAQGKPLIPVRLSDVWARPRPGQSLENDTVWPPERHPAFGAVPSDGGRSICWPRSTLIEGCIRSGTPPAGHFVPADIGAGYVSPGYIDCFTPGNRTHRGRGRNPRIHSHRTGAPLKA